MQMVLLAGGLERSQALEGEFLQVVCPVSPLLPLSNGDSVDFGLREPWIGTPPCHFIAA